MYKRYLLIILLFLVACSPRTNQSDRTIRIKGSDTMYILAQMWAEAYMKANPGISVYCQGGGTVTGTQALIAGSIDICTASRPIRPEEAQMIARKYNSVGVMHRIAKDALSIYLHPSNPVKSLTTEQLKDIFTGKVTNWSELGGADSLILKVNRIPNSGTHLYFNEHVLDGESYSTENTKMVVTAAEMINQVKSNENAIGYGGFVQDPAIQVCQINGVRPLPENVLNDTYPTTRYLYLYTATTPRGHIKQFIEWVLGQEGQNIVKQAGFFPLWVSL